MSAPFFLRRDVPGSVHGLWSSPHVPFIVSGVSSPCSTRFLFVCSGTLYHLCRRRLQIMQVVNFSRDTRWRGGLFLIQLRDADSLRPPAHVRFVAFFSSYTWFASEWMYHARNSNFNCPDRELGHSWRACQSTNDFVSIIIFNLDFHGNKNRNCIKRKWKECSSFKVNEFCTSQQFVFLR